MTVLALGQRDRLRQESSSVTAIATHQVPTHFDNAPAIRQASIVLTTAKNGGVQKCLLVSGEDEIISLGFARVFCGNKRVPITELSVFGTNGQLAIPRE